MKKNWALLGALWMASMPVMADSTEELIRKQIDKINAQIPVASVKPAPFGGLYEVELASGEVIYSDAKGEFFLLGQLYQLTDARGFVNLTEEKANTARKARMATVKDADKVIYPAKGTHKATISIFTDVDCPYCRKLHEEVPALQDMGVQVEYLAFPRAGAGSATHQKMVSIWCADDRLKAMDQSKSGQSVKDATCDNPVLEQYALGQEVGVTGTPAIVTADGQLIPGYVPARRLAPMLGIKP